MYLVAIAISILIGTSMILLYCHQVLGLLQAAGPINVTAAMGHSANFQWIILPDKGKSANVTVSADGNGSQFLSFPKSLELPESKTTAVPVKVTIPSNYSDGQLLNPTMRATEAGKESEQGSIINVEVAKNVTIIVTNFSNPILPNQTKASIPLLNNQ